MTNSLLLSQDDSLPLQPLRLKDKSGDYINRLTAEWKDLAEAAEGIHDVKRIDD